MSADLAEGLLVAGRYRLDRCIGRGGMGVVWAATHTVTRRLYALKILLEGSASPDGRRRMEREARAASAVHHPGVINVHDVVELDDGTPVLVMDLLQGESLADLFEREGALPVGTFARLLLPVVSALGAAHAAGIVHRDLKPANVFILDGGDEPQIKVLDFGIAKLTASEGDAVATTALTGTGTILGTPSYMSPEQVLGEVDIDRRADVWALGCIFYEALAGERPTHADTVGKILRIILTGSIRPIAEVVPDLPRDLAQLVTRMLAFSRENRPDDLREVLEVLEAHTTLVVPKFGRAAPTARASVLPDVVPSAPRRSLELEALAPTLVDVAGPLSAQRRRTRRTLVLGATAVAVVSAAAAGAATLRGRQMAPPPPSRFADVPSGHCPPGMVELLGGTFVMGADDGLAEEGPAHRVSVASFCLGRTEVTVGAYAECVIDGACTATATTGEWAGKAPPASPRGQCTRYEEGTKESAENCVTWTQAERFCRAHDARLPTEAEWEYAARNGPASDPWPWGKEAPTPRHAKLAVEAGVTAAAADDAAPPTFRVGAYPDGASRAGVLDLVGNVWEWTSSPFCSYVDPGCASPQRVFRGGAWTTAPGASARPTSRTGGDPERRFGDVGFRCARDVR